MNKRIIIRLLGLIIVLIVIAMTSVIAIDITTKHTLVSFSRESGCYTKPFTLFISAPRDSKIYYTLNSDVPTENSEIYHNGIFIDNASEHENVYCMRKDVSTGFYTDLIAQYQTRDPNPEYVSPDFLVDKCTVLRVLVVDNDGKKEYFTKCYFIKNKEEIKENEVFIISIVSDPSNLFDYNTGIYVTGYTFDEYFEAGSLSRNWRSWSANYRRRGKEWEREANIQIYNEKFECILDKKVGIRTRGGISRGTIPRGLSVFARNEYDGENIIPVDLFGTDFYAQRLNLDAGGNQTINVVSDYLLTKCADELYVSNKHYVPCEMYLDGEYWGFYWLCEKYDEDYVSHYYGVNENDVVIVKDEALEQGEYEDIRLYKGMKSFLKNNDMSLQSNYEKASEMIDIQSFVDYYALMVYIARCEDWPNGNCAVWRTRNTFGGGYYDGKWRYMLYDCNSSCMDYGDGTVDHDTLDYVINTDPVFSSLWVNNDFKAMFENRIIEIAGSCFDPDRVDTILDEYDEKMYMYLHKSWDRFYGINNTKNLEYSREMNVKKSFFHEREKYLRQWFDLDLHSLWSYDDYKKVFIIEKE